MDTQRRTIKVIAEQLGEQIESITAASRLREDLNCDSLDCVEVMIALEDEFGIRLVDEQFEKLETVQQVVEQVTNVCNGSNSPESEIDRATRLVDSAPKLHHIMQPEKPTGTFCYAEKLAHAARGMDDFISGKPKESAELIKIIATVHACAIELAGNRAHELYASDNESRTLGILHAAGMTGCADLEEAGPGWPGLDEPQFA